VGARHLLDRVLARGAGSQAAIAGTYAWAVTVAPILWDHGRPPIAMTAAGLALVALLAGAVGERATGSEGGRRLGRMRSASLWGFVLACGLAWLSSPAAMRPMQLDAPRALAGMLGWGLFALASAGPALGDRQEPERLVDDEPLDARSRLAGGDVGYLAGGAVVALALQFAGWQVASPERALLVRLVALAAGLSVIGASAELALARHAMRSPRGWRSRLRSARVALALLGGLVLAGVLFVGVLSATRR
jgi:hypothetical protein